VKRFNRNVYLFFIATSLNAIATGVFAVVFNLYALSLGIRADTLGGILTAGPLAQVAGAIPVGILADRLGHRQAFLLVYTMAGLAYLAQATLVAPALIWAAIFVNALAISGDFVVRLPFLAANTDNRHRGLAFSASMVLASIATSVGALLGGLVPSALAPIAPDLTTAYRWTLWGAAALTLSAALPILLLRKQGSPTRRTLRLRSYLGGIGPNTRRIAFVEFFGGLTMGLALPFANVYFVYHLGTTREFFGAVSALVVLPAVLVTAVAPLLATRLGRIRTISGARLFMPAACVILSLTASPLVGAAAYCGLRAFFMMGQSQWFAFSMEASDSESPAATSAWLNITYWLGNAFMTPVAGLLIAQGNYRFPFLLAAATGIMGSALTHLYFRSFDASGAGARAGLATG